MLIITIVMSEFLERHSKAKRTRAPAYSRVDCQHWRAEDNIQVFEIIRGNEALQVEKFFVFTQTRQLGDACTHNRPI